MRRTLAALVVALAFLGLGASSAGAYSNGYLPESALSPIATTVHCPKPEGQLSNAAAASWNSMALAAGRPLAITGCDSAYRPYARQVYWREYWCSLGMCFNAAVPGTSNHGLGLAADVPTPEQGWLQLHGKRFGWRKIEAFTEPWHWNYVGGYRRPNPGTNLHSPILRNHSGGPGQNIYVRKAQKLLRGHGFKELAIDGAFGHETVVDVKRFEKAQHLPPNGIIGPRVWKRLRQPVVKPVPKPEPHHHHAKRHPKGPAWGIDISSNNGSVDFTAVRSAGARFVVSKATESTGYLNPYFGRDQIKAIVDAHLVPGAYDYLEPSSSHSGKAEAAFFTAAVGRAGFGKGWLPPVADIEQTSLSSSGTCHYLGEWVHTVHLNLGVKAMIYASPGFVSSYLAGCSWLVHYPLWVANYGVSQPTIPAPWSTWAIWQHSPTGHVAGAAGYTDLDKVFHGRSALAGLLVKGLPGRAKLPPRAKLSLPLAGRSRAELVQAAPATPAALPRAQVPAPEGELVAPAAAAPESTSTAMAVVDLIHALLALAGE